MKQGISALLMRYAQEVPPDDARAIMRLSVLDWAACGIAGHRADGFAEWAAALRPAGPPPMETNPRPLSTSMQCREATQRWEIASTDSSARAQSWAKTIPLKTGTF